MGDNNSNSNNSRTSDSHRISRTLDSHRISRTSDNLRISRISDSHRISRTLDSLRISRTSGNLNRASNNSQDRILDPLECLKLLISLDPLLLPCLKWNLRGVSEVVKLKMRDSLEFSKVWICSKSSCGLNLHI